MDDKHIVGLLRRQLSAAQDNGPSAEQLRLAMNYYYGRPRGDEMAGRSQVQSLDIADMTHAVMSQVLPSFTQDAICQFEPDGPDDEAQARLETDAVNRVVMEGNRGYVLLYSAIKSALQCKNAIAKVYLADDYGGRRVVVEAVDPLNFLVGPSQDGVLLTEQPNFCAERKEYRRAELVAMGFPAEQVSRISPGADSLTSIESSARNRQGQDAREGEAGWANEVVTVYECYTQLPEEQDSTKTTFSRCLIGGQELLLREPADYVPYAAGTPFIEPFKFWGLSLFDRLKSVQDTKTAILRQWLDNLTNCNFSRTVINDQVVGDDVLTGRPGGVVRVKGMGAVQEAISPLPSLDVGPAALTFLQYMDQVRADRGGAALQMASGEMQLGTGAVGSQGVDRIYSVQEAMAGMIARTLAETLLRSLFLLVHRCLREELAEPMTLRLADQWVEVDPSQWRPRVRVNIKSGLSPGEKSRKVAAMTQVIGYQWQTLQAGQDGVMVTLQNLYNAYLDWASANDLDAGEKYFTDPISQTAQQGMQDKMQGQQQQQAQQAQMMQVQVQLEQAKLQNEQQKHQIDALKADAELKFNYWKESLHAEIEEAKLVAGVTADLSAQQQSGRDAAGAGPDGGPGGA